MESCSSAAALSAAPLTTREHPLSTVFTASSPARALCPGACNVALLLTGSVYTSLTANP